MGHLTFCISQRFFGCNRGLLSFERLCSLRPFCALPAALEYRFNATGFDSEFAHLNANLGKLDDTEVVWLAEQQTHEYPAWIAGKAFAYIVSANW